MQQGVLQVADVSSSLLSRMCRFPGDDIPIVRGSALAALKGENNALGKDKILELMQAVDDYLPTPARALDKPFSMPVEDVFSIQVPLLTLRHQQGMPFLPTPRQFLSSGWVLRLRSILLTLQSLSATCQTSGHSISHCLGSPAVQVLTRASMHKVT